MSATVLPNLNTYSKIYVIAINALEDISSSDNYVKNLYFFAHSLRMLKWTDFFTGGFCYVGIFIYNVGIFNWLWG